MSMVISLFFFFFSAFWCQIEISFTVVPQKEKGWEKITNDFKRILAIQIQPISLRKSTVVKWDYHELLQIEDKQNKYTSTHWSDWYFSAMQGNRSTALELLFAFPFILLRGRKSPATALHCPCENLPTALPFLTSGKYFRNEIQI